MTATGNFVIITTDDIRAIGRVAKGVRAIKLNDGDYVVCAKAVPVNATYITSVSAEGLIKKTPIAEFSVQGKNTKGAKIHKVIGTDTMASFLPQTDEKEILIASTRACIKISTNEIPILSRTAQGNKSIKLGDKDKIIAISFY